MKVATKIVVLTPDRLITKPLCSPNLLALIENLKFGGKALFLLDD
ncbi:hypothetical protein B6N60_03211 [Richelia sinica FACHB-800]|uniref:Uncharacterized protein n=1 Tax=Richelia sinica FACHB-800 TaxID=1357546 RepID=A0A975TAR9_9NOST|nr:hypothetical protein B6N60_03211 [Richelia sinica FACHB-800]